MKETVGLCIPGGCLGLLVMLALLTSCEYTSKSWPNVAYITVELNAEVGAPEYPKVIDLGQAGFSGLIGARSRRLNNRNYIGLELKDEKAKATILSAQDADSADRAYVIVDASLPVRLKVVFLATADVPPVTIERLIPRGHHELEFARPDPASSASSGEASSGDTQLNWP